MVASAKAAHGKLRPIVPATAEDKALVSRARLALRRVTEARRAALAAEITGKAAEGETARSAQTEARAQKAAAMESRKRDALAQREAKAAAQAGSRAENARVLAELEGLLALPADETLLARARGLFGRMRPILSGATDEDRLRRSRAETIVRRISDGQRLQLQRAILAKGEETERLRAAGAERKRAAAEAAREIRAAVAAAAERERLRKVAAKRAVIAELGEAAAHGAILTQLDRVRGLQATWRGLGPVGADTQDLAVAYRAALFGFWDKAREIAAMGAVPEPKPAEVEKPTIVRRLTGWLRPKA